METTYILDDYVMLTPGAPYRLFPFGRLVKGGHVRDITPELAAKFRLPHFKPPIKLGSHEDTTPAGGSIIALEVREDGLYAVPEYTEKGAKALGDGDYRYHSPEVIWEEGALEDPTTGEPIDGPLILGDAMLHTPHLGEAAALYSIQPFDHKEVKDEMDDLQVQAPPAWWEKFTAWFAKTVEEPAQVETAIPEDYTVAVAERDDLRAKLAQIEADKARAAQVEHFQAALAEVEMEEGAEMLASMTDDQAAWVLANFKAIRAQAETSHLFAEVGTTQPAPTDPQAALEAAIQAEVSSGKTYPQAVMTLAQKSPELFAAAGR